MSGNSVAIVAIGDELLLGQTVDTNSAWLAEQVAEIGLRPVLHLTVGDDAERIAWALRTAADTARVVLVTGGLGPTADDLTRQGLASAMGVQLHLDEECLRQIREYFAWRGREMPEANRSQAMIPAGAAAIRNSCGTAPGIRAELGGSLVFVMPGVPREMREMFQNSVRPELTRLAGGRAIVSRTLLCYGAGESDIASKISDLMARGRNPAVGTTPQETIIGVRIVAEGASPEEARRLAAETEREVRRRLGDLVFGEDGETLADAVARLCFETGCTVATAESCTGGLIAKSLTDISGSSRYFVRGYVTYSNSSKVELLAVPDELIRTRGAVSAEVAEAMAKGCRLRSGVDYALAVTGIAGPTGGSAEKPVGLVYIALDGPDGCEVRQFRFGEHLERWQVRDRARKAALNMLRLALLKRRGELSREVV